MLISAMKSDAYVYQAKSTALAQLKAIKTMMAAGAGNAETKAHREHIVFAINKAMEK
jgi:hypothetical protein